MTSEFNYIGSSVKVSGEASLPPERRELEHGDEVYVVARAVVKEVAYPEDKDGIVTRVHKAKLDSAFFVQPEEAEGLIAEERERLSGQGNLIAEIQCSPKTDSKAKKTTASKSKKKTDSETGEIIEDGSAAVENAPVEQPTSEPPLPVDDDEDEFDEDDDEPF